MKNKLLQSAFTYGLIQYFILGMGFIKGTYQAKYLGPALLGSYGLVALIIEYMRYANLGTMSGMNLEASIHHGSENPEKKKYVRLVVNNVFAFITILGIVFFSAALVIHLFFPFLVAEDIRKYIFAIAFFGIVGQFKVFATYYARLNEKYYWMNRLELTSSLILFAGVMAFVARFKLDAVIGSMVVSSAVMLILSLWIVVRHVSLNLDYKVLKSLAFIGFPLLMFSVFEKLIASIDRLTIINWLTREDMGYFTLANTVLSSTMTLVNSLAVVAYPKVLKKFNLKSRESDGSRAVLNDLQKYTSLLSAISIGLGLTGIILMEPFVKIFLPNYIPSILLYQILTIGVMSDNVAYFAGSYLVSNKHQFLIMGLLGIVALFTVSGNFLAIHWGWGLKGIVVVSCLATTFYGLGKAYLALKKIGHYQIGQMISLFRRYALLMGVLILLLIWAPSHLYVLIPIFMIIYLHEIKDLLKRFQTTIIG